MKTQSWASTIVRQRPQREHVRRGILYARSGSGSAKPTIWTRVKGIPEDGRRSSAEREDSISHREISTVERFTLGSQPIFLLVFLDNLFSTRGRSSKVGIFIAEITFLSRRLPSSATSIRELRSSGYSLLINNSIWRANFFFFKAANQLWVIFTVKTQDLVADWEESNQRRSNSVSRSHKTLIGNGVLYIWAAFDKRRNQSTVFFQWGFAASDWLRVISRYFSLPPWCSACAASV